MAHILIDLKPLASARSQLLARPKHCGIYQRARSSINTGIIALELRSRSTVTLWTLPNHIADKFKMLALDLVAHRRAFWTCLAYTRILGTCIVSYILLSYNWQPPIYITVPIGLLLFLLHANNGEGHFARGVTLTYSHDVVVLNWYWLVIAVIIGNY